MFELGCFRRSSVTSGHASNTRSPIHPDRFRGTCAESASARRGEPVISLPCARPVLLRINPTFSTSSIRSLSYSRSLCARICYFLPRRDERARARERESEVEAVRSGQQKQAGQSEYKRRRKTPGGLTLPRISHLLSLPNLTSRPGI